jgi:hypothetical protein
MLVIIFPPLIDHAFSTVLYFLILCSLTDRKFYKKEIEAVILGDAVMYGHVYRNVFVKKLDVEHGGQFVGGEGLVGALCVRMPLCI